MIPKASAVRTVGLSQEVFRRKKQLDGLHKRFNAAVKNPGLEGVRMYLNPFDASLPVVDSFVSQLKEAGYETSLNLQRGGRLRILEIKW